MKVLITSGATREFIDGVRFISNISTGKTGAALADHFSTKDHEVTYLSGTSGMKPKKIVKTYSFDSFQDLNSLMQNLLSSTNFDVVIHAAAVNDYHVAQITADNKVLNPNERGKIDSQNNIELTLRRNFKIVDRIKSYSLLKNIYVIAFKLTHTDSPETRRQAIEKLTLNSQIDFVVHNDLSEIRSLGAHVFHIYDKKGLVQNRLNLIDLGENLENLVKFRREKL